MIYRVVFTPDAEEQLVALYNYIAMTGSPIVAARYVEAIIDYCEKLSTFPYRGIKRDDVRTGLRITNYKQRTVISFAVNEQLISIIGIFYGGQNYETILHEEFQEDDI